ncbi:hypothetical protein LSTR_LSTR016362 [Laodelphax striatellus]|uniref:Uncharacterized protein n=1 Tax=Laodelphax striatellus TaxID=195883 RepID=A0A482WLG4_LAOST|nr:hypothetical protein LSTR_LSTR016362 [Laodelphax striatellus]
MKQRYVLGIMGFLALANGYIQRFCLSLAITEMVNVHHKGKIDPNSCPYDNAEMSANFTKKYLSNIFIFKFIIKYVHYQFDKTRIFLNSPNGHGKSDNTLGRCAAGSEERAVCT